LGAETSGHSGIFVGVPQRVGAGRRAPLLGCHSPCDSEPGRLDGGSRDWVLGGDGMADFAVEGNRSAHVPPDLAALPRRLASRPGLFGLWLDSRMRVRTELLAVDARVLVIGAQLYRYDPWVWARMGRPACHTRLQATRDGSGCPGSSFRTVFAGSMMVRDQHEWPPDSSSIDGKGQVRNFPVTGHQR